MRQATLVAFYGDKPEGLTDVILSCQRILSLELPEAFLAYELPQVHATIVGLECNVGAGDENLNFSRLRSLRRSMDIRGFAASLVASERLPLAIQLAGFDDRSYPFSSRGQHPRARSFSIQGDI